MQPLVRHKRAIPAIIMLTCLSLALPAVYADSNDINTTATALTRQIVNLNGTWKIAFDPEDAGKAQRWYELFPSTAEAIRVPSVWNEIRPNYQGVAWYSTSFSAPSAWQDHSVRISFGAVSYLAEVWLNGSYLGAHEGGYTPFEIETNKALRLNQQNQLVVRVLLPMRTLDFMQGLKWVTGRRIDGMILEEIPASKQIWYDNFGGLWQDVHLEVTEPIWIRNCFVRPDIYAGKIDATCTLANHTGQDANVTLGITATAKNRPAANAAQISKQAVLAIGDSQIDFSVPIPNAHLWSPDDPFLYQLNIGVLTSGKVVASSQFTFGMRDFTIRENRFFLNGKPIFIKATIYQPHYPETLAYPPNPEMLATDIRMIKAAHFNLLRLHIKPQLPRLLELADEQGLLLYEEPPIGWIQKSDQMRERCRREIREMIERDRNHPSLVVWGALNEGAAEGEELKSKLAGYAHQLDPTRLVFDDSGGVYWSGENSHVFIPGSSTSRAVNDIHPYMLQPFSSASFNYYREMQEPHMLNYTSEFGAMGGIEDLDSVIARYDGGREWQDKDRLEEVYAIIEKGFKELGLDKAFGSFNAFARSSRDAQAEALTRMIDALRINPLTAGYDICHWNDSNFEFAFGLVDEWRTPKPSLAAATAANKPLHVIVSRPRFNLYAGDPFATELTIVNDEQREGKAEVSLQLLSPNGKIVQHQERSVSLGVRVEPIGSIRLTAPPSEGDYQLRASLKLEGKSVDVTTHHVLVLKRADLTGPQLPNLAVLDPTGEFEMHIAKLVPKVSAYRPDAPAQSVYLVSPGPESLNDYPLAQVKRLVEFAHRGATVIFFELPMDSGDVSEKFGIFPFPLKVDFPEGFKLQWIRKHPITAGLPSNLVLDQRYADVLPTRFLQVGSDEVVGGMLIDSFGNYRERWLQSLTTNRVGTGHIILCQFRILENLGRDTLSDRFFVNLLSYAQSISHPPTETGLQPQVAFNQQLASARVKVQGDLQRWAVIGPFDNYGRQGLNREYPPEKEFGLRNSYAGVNGPVKWKPVTVWNADGDNVAFGTRFDDWTVHYAYTQIYSPKDAEIRLKLTCQEGCRLWLDGKEIVYSGVTGPNENTVVPVTLQAGWNAVLVKVDRTKMQRSSFRLDVRAKNGDPVPGLLFNFTGARNEEVKKQEAANPKATKSRSPAVRKT
jgi:beta-galactosidase